MDIITLLTQAVAGFGFAYFFCFFRMNRSLKPIYFAAFLATILALMSEATTKGSPIFALMSVLLLAMHQHRKFGGGIAQFGNTPQIRLIGAESLSMVAVVLLYSAGQFELGGAFALIGLALSFSIHTREERKRPSDEVDFPLVMPMLGLLLIPFIRLENFPMTAGLVSALTYVMIRDIQSFYVRKDDRERFFEQLIQDRK